MNDGLSGEDARRRQPRLEEREAEERPTAAPRSSPITRSGVSRAATPIALTQRSATEKRKKTPITESSAPLSRTALASPAVASAARRGRSSARPSRSTARRPWGDAAPAAAVDDRTPQWRQEAFDRPPEAQQPAVERRGAHHHAGAEGDCAAAAVVRRGGVRAEDGAQRRDDEPVARARRAEREENSRHCGARSASTDAQRPPVDAFALAAAVPLISGRLPKAQKSAYGAAHAVSSAKRTNSALNPIASHRTPPSAMPEAEPRRLTPL